MGDEPYQPDTQQHTLRDRIAKAIYQTPPVWDQWPWGDLTDDARQPYREQADAVIAALQIACAAPLGYRRQHRPRLLPMPALGRPRRGASMLLRGHR